MTPSDILKKGLQLKLRVQQIDLEEKGNRDMINKLTTKNHQLGQEKAKLTSAMWDLFK